MPELTGATKQSLAHLLEQARHAVIDGLYLRFDVDPFPNDANVNRLRKTTHLIEELAGRNSGPSTLMSLINYVGTEAAGMPSLRRGNDLSKDFYDNLDRDLAANDRSARKEDRNGAAAAPREPERRFARPGTSASQSSSQLSSEQRSSTHGQARSVFIVRGRDCDVHDALSQFLKALDLRIVTWESAVRRVGGGSPQTLDIVRAGIDMADAVLVLFTPDDLGKVKPEFSEASDDPREGALSGQARQNVVFEAGWALALKPKGVVLVRAGDVRQLSDIHGLNYVSLTNDLSSRRQLISRLKSCGLDLDDDNEDWRDAGIFPTHS